MQSERIESQKQTKTLSRVTLTLCVLCMSSFIGCSNLCPDWCRNTTYTRNKPGPGPGGGQNVPGTNPITGDPVPEINPGSGDPGGIPIAKKCPNCFCPRKSSRVPISGGITYTSDD
jgi:hypothetical protein